MYSVAAILDEKSNIYRCKFISVSLLIKAIENGRRFILNAICIQNLNVDVRQEKRVLSLKYGKQPGVTNDVMFAHAHEKKKLSAFRFEHIFFSFNFMILT